MTESAPALADNLHPMVRLSGIVKRYPGVLANNNANLTVAMGEVHALLGENGAGKSTLMQVLYGACQQDAGDIEFAGRIVRFNSQRDAIRAGIGMIHQDFMLVRPFTVAENVMLGLYQGGAGVLDVNTVVTRIRLLSERHGLEVDPLARIDQLPLGVQQRVEILKLLYRDARLLILDEPTAVLTPQETLALLASLRSLVADGRSVIIVTHKLHEIMAVADRITIMRNGHTLATVDKAATSEAELARLMVGRDVLLKVDRPEQVSGRRLLSVKALQVDDERGQPCVRNVSLDVHAGEIVGIAGVDGNGQSPLVEALMGLRRVQAGRVVFDDNDVTNKTLAARAARGMMYVPADRRRMGSLDELSIEDNAILGSQQQFTHAHSPWLDRKAIRAHAEALITRYTIRTPDSHFHAGKLSGGNLQKLILGRELMRNPRLLIVEQPTRGLDVGAIEFVWAELLAARSSGMAILIVSTELEEILNLADRIIVMFDGRVMGELAGSAATNEQLGLLMAGLQSQE